MSRDIEVKQILEDLAANVREAEAAVMRINVLYKLSIAEALVEIEREVMALGTTVPQSPCVDGQG